MHPPEPTTAPERVDEDQSGARGAHIRRGQRLHRYRIGERLGTGGSGIVYAARDEALGREVAIKVLWPGRWDAELLAREARGVASLRHPNIVTVFDGGFDRSPPYIVMELVDGGSMARWLEQSRPSPDRIVKALVEAARGLAHAHRQGLVHRDFKLDNVLVSRSGRVLVADFGLAADVDRRRRDPGSSPARAGTPPYMAPEQLAGGEVGPAADQYALCVALFTALYGRYPFMGTTREEQLAAKQAGAIARVEPSGISARVHAAMVRGLSVRPEQRFASVDALIAALEPPRYRRWPLWLGLGAAAGLAVIATRGDDLAPCEPTAALWSREAEQEVRQAMRATDVSFAETSADRVDALISRHAEAWARSYEQSCAASAGEAERELAEVARACLRRSRLQAEALTRVLAHADPVVIEHAVLAAESLPDPAVCWSRPGLRPEGDAARWLPLETMLADAHVHRLAGLFTVAVARAEHATREAGAIGSAGLEARAQLERGLAEVELARVDDAREHLELAYHRATSIGDDDTAREAAVALLLIATERAPDLAAAARWDRAAQALLDRTLPSDEARARLLHARAEHAREANDREGWIELHEQALALRRAEGRFTLALGDSLEAIGRVRLHTGDAEGALQSFGEALEIRRQLLSDDHPWLAVAHNNFGIALAVADRQGPARRELEAGLRSLEVSLGLQHPRVGRALSNLGMFVLVRGEVTAARGYLARAARILEQAMGRRHRETLTVRGLLAEALRQDGHVERALALAQTLVTDAEAAQLTPEERAPLYAALAMARVLTGDPQGARAALHAGLARLEGRPGSEAIRLLLRYRLAEVALFCGEHDEAWRRAEALWSADAPDDLRGRVALLRARLLARRGDREEALVMARYADERLPGWARADARRREEIERCLEQLTAPPGLGLPCAEARVGI